jgi:hypothetical protein
MGLSLLTFTGNGDIPIQVKGSHRDSYNQSILFVVDTPEVRGIVLKMILHRTTTISELDKGEQTICTMIYMMK